MTDPTDPTPADHAGPVGMAVPDPWGNAVVDPGRGGAAFARLVDAARTVQNRLVSADLPAEAMAAVSTRLEALAEQLAPYVGPEGSSPAGLRPDLPGRGHTLRPPFVVDERTGTLVKGRVVFGPYYRGGGGAAHGGAVALLFDDVLGNLANGGGRPRTRTAYLTVNYRAITPIDVELLVESTVDRREGRKVFVSGRIHDGGRLIADATGLFVVLRPGQP